MAAEHTVRMGQRIRELRELAGLTQRELAEAIPGKTDGTQVSKWERGKNRPTDDTLEHIAKALKVPVGALHIAAREASTPDLMGALDPGSGTQLDQIQAGVQRVEALVLRLLAAGAAPKPKGELARRIAKPKTTAKAPKQAQTRRAPGAR